MNVDIRYIYKSINNNKDTQNHVQYENLPLVYPLELCINNTITNVVIQLILNILFHKIIVRINPNIYFATMLCSSFLFRYRLTCMNEIALSSPMHSVLYNSHCSYVMHTNKNKDGNKMLSSSELFNTQASHYRL